LIGLIPQMLKCLRNRVEPAQRTLLCSALLVAGCADPAALRTQFVPPELYQGLTCAQIGDEGDRVAQRVAELAGSEYEKGSITLMGNRAIIVHWPTILPETQEADELARLRGAFESLEQAARDRRCGLAFQQRG
jgi:hypothetical protein